MFLLLLVMLFFPFFSPVLSVCWSPGLNPRFRSPPRVEQLALDRVRVSWAGAVDGHACADQFLVKYWQRLYPRDYSLTHLVVGRDYADVEVVPKVIYHFQAVAREEKGAVFGVDYNKSPVVTFQTSYEGGGEAQSKHPFARCGRPYL